MTTEHTRKVYSSLYASVQSRVAVFDERPESGIIYIPESVELVELTMSVDTSTEDVNTVLVLPRPVYGKRLKVLNNSVDLNPESGYYNLFPIADLVDGVPVERSSIPLFNPTFNIAEF